MIFQLFNISKHVKFILLHEPNEYMNSTNTKGITDGDTHTHRQNQKESWKNPKLKNFLVENAWTLNRISQANTMAKNCLEMEMKKKHIENWEKERANVLN